MPYQDPSKAAAWRAANKEKIAARGAAYRSANKEKVAAARKAYRAANREKLAAQNAIYKTANKEKAAVQGATWRAANREKVVSYRKANRKLARAGWLHRTYGLTEDEFQTILIMQSNCCALCFEPFDDENKPCVEHCHDTGVVRGLTHGRCNSGIGHLGDSLHRVMQAARYLLKSGQRLSDPHPIASSIIAALSPPEVAAEPV